MNSCNVSLKSGLVGNSRNKHPQIAAAVLAATAFAAVSGLTAGRAMGQSYAISNNVTVNSTHAYTANDPTGQSVKYTTINSIPTLTPANGTGANLVGTLTGQYVAGADANAYVYTAFTYNSSGISLIGKYSTSSTGSHAQANLKGVNLAGQVLGYENRSDPNSTSVYGVLGQEVWLSTPSASGPATAVNLGLFGPNNTYTATTNSGTFATGTYSYQSAIALSSTGGYAVGTSARYAGDTASSPNTSLGQSAWIETSAGTPMEVGPTGAGYSYSTTGGSYYYNSVSAVSGNGYALGQSSPVDSAGNSLGYDGFVSNGTTNANIGLFNQSTILAPSGSTFYFSPSTGGQGRYTTPTAISSTGIVGAYSQIYPTGATGLYSYTGQIAFTYNPTTSAYSQVGLTTSGFVSSTGQQGSSVVAINATGTVAGQSNNYVGGTNTAAFTQPAGGTAKQIGLYNVNTTVHVNSSYGYYNDYVTKINSTGLVAGYTPRSSSTGSGMGTDAWVYDPITNTTYPVDPTDEASTTNYTFSSINYLSDTGFAVGQFKVGTTASSSSAGPYEGFIWSDANPNTYIPLGTTDISNLTADGYQNLITAYYSDLTGSTIYGTASATNSNNIDGLVTLTGSSSVPEPTCLSLLGMGAAGLLGRRRRVA